MARPISPGRPTAYVRSSALARWAATRANDPAWIWVDAGFNVDAGNNDEFAASLLPETVGTFDYVYRYTTTNGREWLYADLNGPIASGTNPPNPGKLTVNSSGDTTAPVTPANLNVVSASPAGINLAWDAVSGDATLYGYEVLRSNTSGGPYTRLALVTTPSYADTSVVENGTYFYVVRAVDTSFNRSGNSSEVTATAVLRTVTLVFNVTVPARRMPRHVRSTSPASLIGWMAVCRSGIRAASS